MFLNGKRVGDDVMAPGWTDYREHVKYQTYDVTELVKTGKNAIGALLAPGWYATPLEWLQQPNNYGDTPPALKAQLRIEHDDGSVDWVATDASLEGEHVGDSALRKSTTARRKTARLRRTDWDSAEFSAKAMVAGSVSIEPKMMIVQAQDFPPIRVENDAAGESDDRAQAGRVVLRLRAELGRSGEAARSGPAGTNVRCGCRSAESGWDAIHGKPAHGEGDGSLLS